MVKITKKKTQSEFEHDLKLVNPNIDLIGTYQTSKNKNTQ